MSMYVFQLNYFDYNNPTQANKIIYYNCSLYMNVTDNIYNPFSIKPSLCLLHIYAVLMPCSQYPDIKSSEQWSPVYN